MIKPILYGVELSPAVRAVLLTTKAMDFELELRFVFVIISKDILFFMSSNMLQAFFVT